jgi:hypothetical protein
VNFVFHRFVLFFYLEHRLLSLRHFSHVRSYAQWSEHLSNEMEQYKQQIKQNTKQQNKTHKKQQKQQQLPTTEHQHQDQANTNNLNETTHTNNHIVEPSPIVSSHTIAPVSVSVSVPVSVPVADVHVGVPVRVPDSVQLPVVATIVPSC